MTGTTIAGGYTASVTLSGSGTWKPSTLASSARVDVSGASALHGTDAAASTITNLGPLTTPGFGIHLISNAVGETATASSAGVGQSGFSPAGQTLTNASNIAGSDHGITLHCYGVATGSITNQVGGTIEAAGVGIFVVDYGFTSSVIKPGYGPFPVVAPNTTTILNNGVIAGATAVAIDVPASLGEIFTNAATVINAGSIVGTGANGVAIQFAGTASGNLIVEPGATFVGEVDGGSAGSTIHLAAGVGSLSGFGGSIVNFSAVTFDPGAAWTIAGSAAGLSSFIYGFAPGDIIDLTGLRERPENYDAGTLTLTGDQTVLLRLPGRFSISSFQTEPDGDAGTNIFVTGTSGGYSAPITTITSNTLISSFLPGIVKDTPWNIVNYGQIKGSTGIELEKGGSVANLGSGRISGHIEGAGFFYFGHYTAIYINGGGSVTNAANAIISDDVEFHGVAGTVINAGVMGVDGGISGAAIYLPAGSRLTNAIGGTISGPQQGLVLGTSGIDQPVTVVNAGTIVGGFDGISLRGAGTVINSGMIAGAPLGDAVRFDGTAGGRLIVDPGAVFIGGLYGGASDASIELAAGGAGTLTGFGTGITGFTNIIFDADAKWTIAGSVSGLGGIISGFAAADTIDLIGLSETIENYAAGTLTLGGDQAAGLRVPGTFTTASFHTATDGNAGTDIFLACFAAGTRIATEHGGVAVEHLGAGDHALTLGCDGAFVALPIRWIGRRRIDLARHPRPDQARPIRIRRDAFADNVPNRDLLLSPDHAIYAEGVLIPVRCLVDGSVIAPDRGVRFIEYYHVEMDRHAILIAEDMLVESYLDTGDRSAFENGGARIALHPDFAIRAWEAGGCAPLVVAGRQVTAVRALLARRGRMRAARVAVA